MAPTVDGSPKGVFRQWMRNLLLTGCGFASRFASDLDRVLYSEFVGDVDAGMADNLTALLDEAGAARRVAVLLFPTLRGDEEIAALVRVLASNARWKARVDPAFARDAAEVGIELTWTTSAQESTHAMGFAPSGYMPVTRRGPFVALAAWTGGHENPLRTGGSSGIVTMGDAPPPDAADKERYSAMFDKTQQDTNRLLVAPEVPAKVLRRLAFRLPRRVVDAELGELASPS